ncbi:YTH domain family 2 [Cryptococcus deuterogattii 99/473]|uniref:YTH domain family 2 n=1 Tax=Cryptococcus deuterogattii Ram5 TaxID=1296110 RepID=A0A0D0V5P8_9TREE|nr:YTH domain family 2 [Cryptococcus deuterogattii Ram5]KIY59937.1 YTH domain family 2 [Cryptococcus deuterogattii 99/473]
MSHAPVAPIRQPRGPSTNSFSQGASPTSSGTSGTVPVTGPPAPDTDSLRRANTVSNPRHQPSASISANPAASSAFHGVPSSAAGTSTNSSSKGTRGVSRFRSGSLSNTLPDPGLVRRASGREVAKEVVLENEGEGEGIEAASWGRGLSRQSSLPSRRGLNLVQAANQGAAEPAPPRPPRRIAINTNVAGPTPPLSAHSTSHSLSSLSVLHRQMYSSQASQDEPLLSAPSSGVSRTQSLRAQAKHNDAGGLGRSISLKAVGELPLSDSSYISPTAGGADVKRHQSLTHGYGSSSRVRDRLERSPAITLEPREPRDTSGVRVKIDTRFEDEPPTSPIGPSVWSNNLSRTDDGWSSAPLNQNARNASQQLQDAFEAINLGRNMVAPNGSALLANDLDPRGRLGLETDIMRRPQPSSNAPAPGRQGLQRMNSGAEEPSWVNKLVGGDSTPMVGNVMSRSSSALGWGERRRQNETQGFPYGDSNMPFGNGFHMGLKPPMGQMGMPQMGAMGMTGMPMGMPMGMGPLNMGFPMGMNMGFTQMGANGFGQFAPGHPGQVFPSPPNTAAPTGHGIGAQDREVIELARKKGLNPATFNCQPQNARFFVIKSYTEEDVQKSLKHEIWSSTVLGNKRLDAAFRETANKGPVYLFFSVNGSRHFCGVAEMITPALRHIRLTNTPECKPITNSRDTQELPYEAGTEVLQIFLDYQTKSKTSLLQDFAYYEQLSVNRQNQNSPENGNIQNQQPSSYQQFQQKPGIAFAPPMSINLSGSTIPPVPPIPDKYR